MTTETYKTVPTCETLGNGEEELRYHLEVANAEGPDGEPIQAIHLQLVHVVEIPMSIAIPGVYGVAVKEEHILTFLTPQAARELVEGLTQYLESLDIPCPVDQ